MKRLQYFAMLCVFVTLFAGSAWGAVAKIGSTEYENLSALATAIGGTLTDKTIRLSDDKTLGGTLIISTDTELSLDLNGKTLSLAGQVIHNRGKLTIIDTTGNGKVVSSTDCAIGTLDNSTLILGSKENSSYNNFSVEAQEAAILTGKSKNATIYVYGGTYTTKDNAVFMTNGSTGYHGHKWYIYDGTFNGNITTEGYVACGIYAPNSDDWYVYGGTFNITKGTGILARAGTVHIPEDSKVVINTTGNVTGKVGDSRVVVPCAPIVFDTSAGYPGLTDDSKIIIGGGTFSSEVDNISFVSKDNDVIANRFNVTGGNFTSDPTSYLASESYKSVQIGEHYYVVSSTATVSADLTATSIDYGKTLADSTISGTIKIGDVVIDSSDYTLAWASPDTVPTVAGGEQRYEVTVSPAINGTSSFTVKITVNKVDSSVTTAPTAVASLVANGTAQALITAGTAENGEMQYALGSDDQTAPTTGYSTTIPTGIDAGEYYVWYKVVGDANHNDTTPVCITVTIKEAETETPGTSTTKTLSSFDVTISGDTALTATYGTSATKTFTASVKAGYSDGTTSALT